MFYFTFIIFSKTISLTRFHNFNKTYSEKRVKKYLHDKDTKYYIENICYQFPNLYMSSNSR